LYDGITVDLIDHSVVNHPFNYLVVLMANYINCSTHIVINDKADEFHKTINVTAIVGSNPGIINRNVSRVVIVNAIGALDLKAQKKLLRSSFLMLAYCCYW
jgi:hypothetical protein